MLGTINPIFAGTVVNGLENYLSARDFSVLHEFYSSFLRFNGSLTSSFCRGHSPNNGFVL